MKKRVHSVNRKTYATKNDKCKQLIMTDDEKKKLIAKYDTFISLKYAPIQQDLARRCISEIENNKEPSFPVKYIKDYVKKQQSKLMKVKDEEVPSRKRKVFAEEQKQKQKENRRDKQQLNRDRQYFAYSKVGKQEWAKNHIKPYQMAQRCVIDVMNGNEPKYTVMNIVKEGIKQDFCIKNKNPKQTRQNRFLRSPQNNDVNHEDYYIDKNNIATGKSKSQPQKPTSNRKNNINDRRITVFNNNMLHDDPHFDTTNPMEQTVIHYTSCNDTCMRKELTRLDVSNRDMDKINQIKQVPVLSLDINNCDKQHTLISRGSVIHVQEPSRSLPKKQTNKEAFNNQCQKIANNIMTNQQINHGVNFNI